MKIAVVAIAKNEEQFVQRWAESAADADYRIILDTMSTDRTVGIANRLGVKVHIAKFDPWRFDVARNYAMDLIPEDTNLVIWLDMDEVLQPGWREALETVPDWATRVRYKYVWSWNPDGSEGLVYGGDKIHRYGGWRWKHPVHEVLHYDDLESQYWTDGLEIHHHPDHTKSRGQYLDLLKLAVEEDPRDDRNVFYLARELYFHKDYGLAQFYFKRHLALSKWGAEKAASHRYIAKMREEAKDYHLYRAIAEAPERREAWVELALLYHENKDWVRCRTACMMALAIEEKPLDYLCEAFAWGAIPHDLMAVSSYHLGDMDEAFYHGSLAVSLEPDNERLQGNLIYYRG